MIPFFSIITAIFNKKIYIEQGIKLLLNQDFNSFEILLVDDGSNDGSEKICDELAKNNKKIRVIHQNNKGLGSARNSGIDLAKGEYICFFDIDDQIGKDWLLKLYDLIKIKNPDILVYSYREINLRYKIVTELNFPDIFCYSNPEIKNIFIDTLSGLNFNNGFAWNKVYKRDFLIKNDIHFPDIKIQQDEVFNHNVYKHAKTLMTSSLTLYDYYIYEKGNTRNSYIPYRLNIFNEVKKSFFYLLEYWDIQEERIYIYIHLRFFRNILNNRNPYKISGSKKFFKELKNNVSLKETIKYLYDNRAISLTYLEKIYCKALTTDSFLLFFLIELYKININRLSLLKSKLINLISNYYEFRK